MPRVKRFNPDEVLEKAMNVFWEKGYHATSMQDLVDNLGINRASIYDTYGSKSELFEQTLKKYQKENAKRIADFLYQYINVREGLYYLFEMVVNESCQQNPSKGCLIINTISELANSDEQLSKRMCLNKEEFEQIYFNYLQYGVNQGQISPYKDIKAIASYLYTLQGGLKVISKVQKNREELLKIISTGLSVLD